MDLWCCRAGRVIDVQQFWWSIPGKNERYAAGGLEIFPEAAGRHEVIIDIAVAGISEFLAQIMRLLREIN